MQSNKEMLIHALSCYDFLFSTDLIYKQSFEKMNGLTALENLQYFKSKEVINLA